MKVILDTNVFISGVFFSGPPHQIQDLPKPVCNDPDDDKFLACAIASGNRIIVSGDKHLLKVTGYQGIEILKPHEFVKRHLQKS